MSEFDKMCQEAEDIDWETRCRIVKGKSEEILPLLERKSVDGVDGKEILATFLFSAMAADNKLTEEEQWAKLKLVKEIAEEVWN